MKRKKLLENTSPYLYLAPALVIIIVFRFLPMIYAVAVSFCEWNVAGFQKFIFLENYSKLLTAKIFWKSLFNTLFFSIGTVPIGLFLAMFMAIFLNQKIKGLGWYRTVYFMPVVTSLVAISMVWKWIFHERMGLANYFLDMIGLEPLEWLGDPTGVFSMFFGQFGVDVPNWMGGPSLALTSIIIVSVWKGLGYNIVIFLAGLQNIPDHYYEAAKIDGANNWHRFRHVTWPLLTPTTFYVLVMTTIISFQVFTQIYLMTGPPPGAPMDTTKVIVYYLYEQGFDFYRSGYASAIASVLFLIILALTLFQRKVVEKRVHYA
ncbi:MAG: sugar ABC transporter permease [Candidatus Cloacimonetes bacterium 4572_55]|nr:MAG: sugar ABC transporter permease [Candidatus Cloacimonetes bacterium 4572_55]